MSQIREEKETPEDYIKHTIAKCRAYSAVYHQYARYWWWTHLFSGILGVFVGLATTVVSFVVSDPTTATFATGLVISTSSGIFAALQAGQRQAANESAGDDYNKLGEELHARLVREESVGTIDYCHTEMIKLTTKYREPDPNKVLNLIPKTFNNLFGNRV